MFFSPDLDSELLCFVIIGDKADTGDTHPHCRVHHHRYSLTVVQIRTTQNSLLQMYPLTVFRRVSDPFYIVVSNDKGSGWILTITMG